VPEKRTLDRARADRRAGKAPATQAGEFIREQIDQIRRGRHGARSTQQAIAIGLSQARRAGVDLPPPRAGKASSKTRKRAASDFARGRSHSGAKVVSKKRSRASENALKREGSQAASSAALSRQARSAAARRSPAERSAAARQAARTKGSAARRTSALKAGRTRSLHAM
jgi:hypothetical protein